MPEGHTIHRLARDLAELRGQRLRASSPQGRFPAAESLDGSRLEEIEPHAKELGSDSELEGIHEILSRGNGSDRQLRVYNANRDIVEVVRVRVSPETLQDRLRARGLERDRFKLAHWDEYWDEHGGQPCAWTGVRLSECPHEAPAAETALDISSGPTR